MVLNPSALGCSFPSCSEAYALVRREAGRHGGAAPRGFGKHEVSVVGLVMALQVARPRPVPGPCDPLRLPLLHGIS